MTIQAALRGAIVVCASCLAFAPLQSNAFCVYNKTGDAKTAFYEQAKLVTTNCAPGQQFDSGLCYKNCSANYGGAGPVCWGNCPSGWADHGVGCTKPPPYGRGAGYAWHFGDALNDSGMYSRCEHDNGRGRCEKDGAIVYPKCKAGFHKVGCCICSPDCPSGYGDTGATCAKPTYGRGAGTMPLNSMKVFQAESVAAGASSCCNSGTSDCNPAGQVTSQIEFQVRVTNSKYSSSYIECFTGSYSAFNGNQQDLPKIEAGGWLEVVNNPKFDGSAKKWGSDNPPYLVHTYRANGQPMGDFTCPGYSSGNPGLMDFL